MLKVLNAPTIIKYYDNYIENDSLCILMEYGSLGTLYDKLQEFKSKNMTISEDEALYFTA